MHDRATQCLVKMALEPEWEAKFEPNSYGFRPGRACHDAIEAIFNAIKTSPKYVLDADISQCFDKINHQKLLRKLNTFPSLRRQIRAWLRAKMWEDKKLTETTEGTPQGGVISPLLANIALHGIEESIKKLAETLNLKDKRGRQQSKRDKRHTLSLIRYADDFVILHKEYSVILKCKELVSNWLNDIGLELKPSKTSITHTLHNVGSTKAGFDFLGFNVRQFKAGKYRSGKDTQGNLLGYKTIIKPSKKSILQHYKNLAYFIDNNKPLTQKALITRLNAKIRGWCNYYSIAVSKKAFRILDNILKWKLWKWGVKRHNNKRRTWIKTKYFHNEMSYDDKQGKVVNRDWIFSTTKDEKIEHKILFHSDTEIIRHTKVKGDSSPYDGNLVYWSTRMGRNPLMPMRKAILLKAQKGKCSWCKLTFRHDDILEEDHIIPKSKGGNNYYKNLQLLHRHCHDKKTCIDGSLDKTSKQIKLPPTWRWENDMLLAY